MSTLDFTQYANEDRGELTVAPSDEYVVRLIAFKKDNDGDSILYYGEEQDKPYMMLRLEIADCPEADNYKDFTYFMGLPNSEMTGKQKKQCLHKMDLVGQAFGIDFFGGGEIALEDIEGKATAMAIVSIRETEAYGEQNEVKQFLVNR